MTHRNRLFFLSCLIFIAFLAVPLLAAEKAAAEDDCRIFIAGIVGECEMALDPAKEMKDVEWEKAELDICLAPGDLLRTKKDSLMAVSYGKEKEVRVNALSLVKIEAPDDKKADQLTLSKGQAYSKVTGKNPAFSIKTPTAIAGVRGTEFDVEVDEEGGTKIHVLEGEVAIFNDLGEVLAAAGMATEILKGELPIEPFKFDLGEYKKKLDAWKDQIQIGKVVEKLKEQVEEKKEEIKDKIQKPKFKF